MPRSTPPGGFTATPLSEGGNQEGCGFTAIPLSEGGDERRIAPLREGGGLEEAGGSTACVTASAPSATSLRSAAFEGVIYDPATEGEKIDWWRFHNSLTADALLEFAHVVREIARDEKEIGAFFGYWFICNNGLASVGHLDY